MADIKDEGVTETFSITVRPQVNGQYFCQLSSTLSDSSKADIQCHGQTKEHAMAIALENLASKYRRMAEESQNIDSLAVERTESGEAIDKRYHVMLHYECVIKMNPSFQQVTTQLWAIRWLKMLKSLWWRLFQSCSLRVFSGGLMMIKISSLFELS
jgi:hypothetical protein